MKKKIALLWIALVVCIITTVILWFAMNKSNPEYEEVKATVVSTKTEQIVNKKTGSRTNLYKVEVRYDNETYDLENVHSLVRIFRRKNSYSLLSTWETICKCRRSKNINSYCNSVLYIPIRKLCNAICGTYIYS